jgi:hypothetical protein
VIGVVSECLIRWRWASKERRVGRPVTGGGGDAFLRVNIRGFCSPSEP